MWNVGSHTVGPQVAIVVLGTPPLAIAGSYISTFLFESRSTLADYHLGVRAWLRTWLVSVSHATRDAIAEEQPLLPVHFVWVLRPHRRNSTSQRIADPFQALTTAQGCAIEAALRLAPVVNIWVVGGTFLPTKKHRDAWTAWQRGLARHNDRSLGRLVVRVHHFHKTTLIGTALRRRGVGVVYEAREWAARGLPSHPAAVSDLVRLDVLEGEGGIYLDLDVIALHNNLLRLHDGVALQAHPPWHPFAGGTAARPLYQLLNNAVLVSRSPNGSLPRAMARCALRSLADAAPIGWGLLGPRAATEAWVGSSVWRPQWRLYSESIFGFVACGRDHDGAVRCVDYSSSDLPLDCETDAVGWEAFREGRLAQHGIKNLRFHSRARAWRGPTCEQGPGTLRARIAQEACPAAWALSGSQAAAGRRRRRRMK